MLSVTAPGFTGSGNANTGFVRVSLVRPMKEAVAKRDRGDGEQEYAKVQ